MRKLLAALLLTSAAAPQDDVAKRLLDDDPAVRAAAAEELGKMGPAAESAVPQLIDATWDEEIEVAKAAIEALGRIGPAARTARPPLLQMSAARAGFERPVRRACAAIGGADEEPPLFAWLRARSALPEHVRTRRDLVEAQAPSLKGALLAALREDAALVVADAALVLGQRVVGDAEATAAIAPLVDDRRMAVRMSAAWAVRDIGGSATLVAALTDANVRRRRLAAACLRGPDALPHLRRALKDEDLLVRRNALRSIADFYQRAEPALPDLVAILDGGDPALAREAALALLRLGPAAAPALPAVARRLADPDPRMRTWACSVLSTLKDHAAPAVPALALACYDEDTGVVFAALDALTKLGPVAKDAAPLLAELAEADFSQAGQAREALKAIGSGAPLPPLPEATELAGIRSRLGDPDGRVAGAAAFAIGRLAPKDGDTIEALAAALGHASPYARKHALLALERIGTASLPVIVRVAREGSPVPRCLAAQAIVHFAGPAPDEILPIALELLHDDDARVRSHAAGAIGVIGRAAHGATPALIPCLGQPDNQLVQSAIWALWRLGPEASGAVPHLVDLLERIDDLGVVSMTIQALGEIGFAAEAAVPSIVGAALESRGTLFTPAVDALAKTGPRGHAALVTMIREGRGFECQYAIQKVISMNLRPPGLKEALEEAIKDPANRDAALIAMPNIGPEIQPTPEALIAALRTEDKDRFAWSYLPHRLLPVVSVSTLMDLTSDDDVRVRWGAWRTLSMKEPKEFTDEDRARALPLLLDVIDGDDHIQVRYAATDTLRSVPLTEPDPRALRHLLGKDDPLIRGRVFSAVAALGTDAVPGLVKALGEADPGARLGAGYALSNLGPAARPAVPALLEAAIADPKGSATFIAAIVATKDFDTIAGIFMNARMPGRDRCGDALAAGGAEALPFVDRARRHADPAIRFDSVSVLLRLGDLGLPGLLEAAEDSDTRVATAAIHAIGRAKVPPEQAIPVLARAIRNDTGDIRSAAFSALRSCGEAALPLLRELAASPDPKERAAAVGLIGALGPPALHLVVAALKDADPSVRMAGAKALRGLKEAAPAVPALGALLRDENEKVREAATATLSAMGPPALDILADASRDPAPACRAAAANALRGQGEGAIAPLRTLLGDTDPGVRKAAAASLGAIGGPAVETLGEALGSEDPIVLASAAEALGAAGSAAAPAVPNLISLLGNGEPAVREAAARSFGRLGAAAAPAVPALRGMLKDPEPSVRRAAADTLGRLRHLAEAAVPDLAELFRTGDDADRAAAARALLSLRATAALLALATDPEPRIRAHAVGVLPGAMRRSAVEPLVAALKDADPEVRAAAANGLGSLEADALPALSALRGALGDGSPGVRAASMFALAGLGVAAGDAAPEIAELFRSGDDNERLVAAKALRGLGRAGASALVAFVSNPEQALRGPAQEEIIRLGAGAVPLLVPLMGTDDDRARREIATVLVRIGSASVRALSDLLRDESAHVRRDAAWALGTIGPDARGAVADLVAALDDKDAQVAPQAAWALGQMGPAAKDALPALQKMYDAKRHVGIVADAIRRILGS